MTTQIDNTRAAQQIQAIAAEIETHPGPIRMINLIQFREQADYVEGQEPEDGPFTGQEAYQRYGELTAPLLAGVQGKAVSYSHVNRTVIGSAEEEWDQVFIVHYPNRAAFVSMLSSAEYQAIAHHRTAAVSNSRLILTEELM